MNLKLNIACDDINPKQGYRLLGEKSEKWFRQLNEEFGCKFDLFIPSQWHGGYKLSENKEWINELNELDWVSINAHGHFHACKDPITNGECEFAEIQDHDIARDRINMMYDEWASVGFIPKGFRPPGWLCSEQSNHAWNDQQLLEGLFHLDYVAVHYEHNRNLKWNCKTFFGHDNIQSENIGIHNEDMIMFQSHIAGNHNLNVWNEANYEQLRISIDHLVQNHTIEFKTLKECL